MHEGAAMHLVESIACINLEVHPVGMQAEGLEHCQGHDLCAAPAAHAHLRWHICHRLHGGLEVVCKVGIEHLACDGRDDPPHDGAYADGAKPPLCGLAVFVVPWLCQRNEAAPLEPAGHRGGGSGP